ncbi:MAG: NYN domain-containing protein [Planctomycetota bacterium]
MSLLLLIDGYNVSAPIRPGRDADARWLERHRAGLLRDLTNHLEEAIRHRTCVVFDAANPPKDRPPTYVHQGIEVRFAIGYPTADDLLEEMIQAHHTPRQLMVVSSDHRVQVAARRRGAAQSDSEPWMDDLTDGVVNLATGKTARLAPANGEGEGSSKKPDISDAGEVQNWLREFGFDD